MAMFLVLVFQILFVFFAMSINVGLVVFDKINLQTATDLAAYYAAQKQAEQLNQIAHINYQIRQAYKLLTFRLRVIGSVSIGVGPYSELKKHPLFTRPAAGQETNAFFEELGSGRHSPGVCVGSTLWKEYAITEGSNTVSLCQNLYGFSAVPPASGGSDPLGLIGGLNGFLNQVARELEQKCKMVGVLNWQLASSWLAAYVVEAQERTKMIEKISQNMSADGNTVQDFTGQPILVGVQKTLQNNLTDPQREALGQIELTNSLSLAGCGGVTNGTPTWLPKVEIYPVATYVQMIWTGYRCTTSIVPNRSASFIPPSAYIAMVGGGNNNLYAQVWANTNPVPMGVEKNPWCMPWMGVKASTSPRKIFAPFGKPITLTAEAYAKPFGGRIGPWYNSQWPSGSATSSGGNRTDPLLPARAIASSPSAGSSAADLVNHSKYPGDTLGMNSTYALGTMSQYWSDQVIGGAPFTALPPVLALANYNHIGSPDIFRADADSLVQGNQKLRLMEEAALAPDLFDTTYYSVEAQYSYNYLHPSAAQFKSSLMTTSDWYPDLGSQRRNPYSVQAQITNALTVFSSQVPFFTVDNMAQLLTGWTQNSAANYDFPGKFGVCDSLKINELENNPSPSGCPAGGRNGYSVKIVSKNHLLTTQGNYGGGSSGPILNPPQDDDAG